MKPVDQTILKTESTNGNCLAACVASLLEIPIESVPNFADFGTGWFGSLAEYLKLYNLAIWSFPREKTPGYYHIVMGQTVRGTYHCVVAHGREMAHDPHPSKAGLLGAEEKFIFVPLSLPRQVQISIGADHA